MAETTPANNGLASTGFFGFLLFIVATSPVGEAEVGNTLTRFGLTTPSRAVDCSWGPCFW
jgi:hypothetical protein